MRCRCGFASSPRSSWSSPAPGSRSRRAAALAGRSRGRRCPRGTPGNRACPIGADDALGKALGEPREAGAVVTVHRDAASLGDESRNPVGRRGLAAARELREQALDAHDENPAARLSGPNRVRRNFLRTRALRPAAQSALQLPRADFLAADRSEERVGLAEAEALCQILEARALPSRCSSRSTAARPAATTLAMSRLLNHW